jgi:ketosteroid isomerase-like protein
MHQVKLLSHGRAGRYLRRLLSALAVVGLAACAGGARDVGQGEEGIDAVSTAWKQAYNAADFKAVTALYADDAVLSAPGVPVVMGKAAIGDYFAKLAPVFAQAGLTVADAPLGRAGTSGDLGFQWKTYRILDKSGAVVDAGKLLTLFRRSGSGWLIIGDTWNSDRAPPH